MRLSQKSENNLILIEFIRIVLNNVLETIHRVPILLVNYAFIF
jgi:hypothetical protein